MYDWHHTFSYAQVHNHIHTVDQLLCHPGVQPYIITSITSLSSSVMHVHMHAIV